MMVTKQRHKELLRSAIGTTVTMIHFSESGDLGFVFSNGLEIHFQDGWCSTLLGDEEGCGSIYENEEDQES